MGWWAVGSKKAQRAHAHAPPPNHPLIKHDTTTDPHPGNLIRTPDGRLAILDFGLMTEVDDGIKYGMIEAISHLIHRDYDAIVEARARAPLTRLGAAF